MKQHKFFNMIGYCVKYKLISTHSFTSFVRDVFDTQTYKAFIERFIEKRKYGFDNTDLWSLDITMIALLYERLMLFQEYYIKSDSEFYEETLIINDEEKTYQEWVVELIDMCDRALTNKTTEGSLSEYFETQRKNSEIIWVIWSKLQYVMWD